MLVKLISPEFKDEKKQLSGKFNTNSKPELIVGKIYLALGIWFSVEQIKSPGMAYFDVREDREGSMNMCFPAPLFEIVENRIPQSYRLFHGALTNEEYGSYGISHWELLNDNLIDGIIEYEPWAIQRLNEIEREIILEMGYEKYFPEKI